MSVPIFVGKRPTLSATSVLETLGADLLKIKIEDRLTWTDVGRVLGKGDDIAARYAAGQADMGIVSLAFAEREWAGRITGSLRRMIHCDQPGGDSDRSRGSKVLAAALAMSLALEGDDEIDPEEVRRDRATLEAARDAIIGVLAKLTPKVAA